MRRVVPIASLCAAALMVAATAKAQPPRQDAMWVRSTAGAPIVLDGKLEFSLNDDGGEKIVLGKWDTFSCPPGVNRGFRNVDTKDSVLLTVITGGINDRNDIGLPPAIAKQIEAVDPQALEVFKTKMGLRFDAGPEV